MLGTVKVAVDGSVSWHADTAVALGPIMFQANGVQFVVDAAAPEQIIDLAAVDAAALRSCAQWFVDPTLIEAIAAADDGAHVAGPIAGDAILRVATVESVDAIVLSDLDEGVLLVDQAYAATVAGDLGRGAVRFALASAVVDRIVTEIENDDYLGPLNSRLLEVVSAAPEGTFLDAERSEYSAIMRARLARTDAFWRSFADATIADDLALTLGEAQEVTAQAADLRLLPPRLLAFAGPEVPEVTVVAGDGELTMSAQLRPAVDLDSAEANELFAVVADKQTGALVAHAPARVVDDRVQATVSLHGIDPETVRCALVGGEVDLDAVRLDDTGDKLAGIDRQCRFAWSEHRRAGALLASVSASSAESEIENVGKVAARARKTAEREIRSAAKRATRLGDSAELTAYADAVQRLSHRLSEAPEVDGPAGPTIAELYAVAL